MKVSALILVGASLAAAAPQKIPSDDVPINCAQANSNYCMGGDIILRCNDNAIGTRSRCSADLSGQPPTKGVASCWQSGEEAGDAACAKNCVVYADEVFTLSANECSPIFIEEPEHPHHNTTIVPPAPMPTIPPPVPSPNGTIPQPPPTTGPEPTGEPTNVPQPPPTSPTEPEPVPTAGAAVILPGAFLAGFGMVAAYLI